MNVAERLRWRREFLDDSDKCPDDFLIDVATTCSNRGLALVAEMRLRRRYPSRKAIKRKKGAAK